MKVHRTQVIEMLILKYNWLAC